MIAVFLLLVLTSTSLAQVDSGGLLQVLDLSVTESVGNMDGSLDSGETGMIQIVIRNILGEEARSVGGTITTNQSDVLVLYGNPYWGNIENGSSLDSSALPIKVQLLPQNDESTLLLTLLIVWRDTSLNWHNTTTILSMPINRGYEVSIDTGGFQHDVIEPIIVKAGLVGKLDREPVLGAQVTMTLTEPYGKETGPIQVRDDGEGFDEEAGDGVYTSRYVVMTPFPIGLHQITVDASKNGLQGRSSVWIRLSDPFLVWNKTSEGWSSGLVPSGDGGFVISGRISTPGVSGHSYLIKVDGEGNKIWEQTYARRGPDRRIIADDAGALAPSGDGGFVVTGNANCPVSSADHEASCDICLWKVDAKGVKIWEKTYGGDSFASASCIIQSGDGGFLVGGAMSQELYVLKTDSEGNKVWEETYPSLRSGASDIIESGDGGYILTGHGDNERAVYVVKIDSEGNKIWGRTYGGPNDDYGSAIIRNGEGFIVAGGSSNVAGSLDALYLLGLDGEGNVTWEKTYIKEHSLGASCIIPAGDGFIVSGQYWGDGYFLKIDGLGNKIWETTIPYCLAATSMAEAGDGGFIFLGRKDFYIGKIGGTPYIPIGEAPTIGLLVGLIAASSGCRPRTRQPGGVTLSRILGPRVVGGIRIWW